MCLNVKKGSTAKIAKRNIVVYKDEGELLRNGGLQVKFGNFTYKPLQENEEIEIEYSRGWLESSVERAYHSYKWMFNWGLRPYLLVIPKGATYYEGVHNHIQTGYASSNLIFVGKTSIKNWFKARFLKPDQIKKYEAKKEEKRSIGYIRSELVCTDEPRPGIYTLALDETGKLITTREPEGAEMV